ncbi:MAG TPA: HDOD domain-containing protein [Dissulfurispiraceae bacterium]|nr:HDOD domain-containing protein [Dissulfurispiraceae bacterium]
MQSSKTTLDDILTHPVFVGVSDAESAKIAETGVVHTLAAGDSFLTLFSTLSFFLILSGSLSLRFDRNKLPAEILMPAGNWIGECQASEDLIARLSFLRPIRTKLDIRAIEPTILFVIPEQKLRNFAFQDQVRLIKNLDRSSHQLLETLILEGIELESRAKRLTGYITGHVRQKDAEYAKSEIIQSIVQKYPRLPLYATKLVTAIQGEHTSANEIVEAAKLDPSLAGLILRVANSSYYNLPQKVTDFQHAVLLLGFNQIYHMLMDAGIQSIMPKTNDFHKVRFDSVLLSFIAFELAMASNALKPVAASTVGLLQCVGQSVLLLLKKQHPTSAILFDGLDHGKLGSLLLQTWNIPDAICKTIEHQSVPEFAAPETLPHEYRTGVAVLFVARLCYQYLEGADDQDLHTIFLADYQKHLGLAPLPVKATLQKYVKPGIIKKIQTFPDNVKKFLAAVESRWA